MLRNINAMSASFVALECAQRMQGFFRDVTFGGVPRIFAKCGPSTEDFIEYIPPRGFTVSVKEGTPTLTSRKQRGGAVMDSHVSDTLHVPFK